MQTTSSTTLLGAKPFLKWVGGKQQLLSQFKALFPKEIKRYFEPFVGGGAVYFYLHRNNMLPDEACLYDNNKELVNTYKVVRDDLDNLIECLATHKLNHSKEYYYKIRDLDRSTVELSNIEKAARTIYLNKTGFNGLFRVNSKGYFNVPIGSYKNPQILNEDLLRAASKALQNTIIEVKDFREASKLGRKGDFFYFDPPYDPVSKTANFTNYTANAFLSEDQVDLANAYKMLTNRGCYCMLSNSYTPFILKLYSDFQIREVIANRAVNSKGNARGGIKEVVVLNYDNEEISEGA